MSRIITIGYNSKVTPPFGSAGAAGDASGAPVDAASPDAGSPSADGGRGGPDLRSQLGNMPEVRSKPDSLELVSCRLSNFGEGAR